MVIKHNMTAENASRQLGLVAGRFAGKAEKLSSGYRINRSADDAAGLSISEKMRRQIRGLTQASLNSQEGISYVQTAEGALNEVHDMLQRGNELCVRAGNDTNSDEDREYIQAELDQLRAEIDRVAKHTTFNEMEVFDAKNAGSVNATDVIAGARSNGPVIKINPLDWDSIAAEAAAGGKTFITADAAQKFAEDLKNTYMPGILAGIESAIPSAEPQVDLEIGLTLYHSTTDGALGWCSSSGAGFEMRINMAYLEEAAGGGIEMSGDLAQTIVHEMTHAVMFDYVTSGMMGASGANSLPGYIVEGMAQAVGGGIGHCAEGLSIYKYGTDKELQDWLSHFTDDDYSVYAEGYIASMYLGYLAGGGTAVDKATISAGVDRVLKHIADGYSLSQTINIVTNGKYEDAADFENSFPTDGLDFAKELLQIGVDGGAGALANASLTDSDDDLLTITGTGDYFDLNIDQGGFVNNADKFAAAGLDYMNGGGYTTTDGRGLDGSVNPDAAKTWGTGNAVGGGGSNRSTSGGGVTFVQAGAEAGQHIDVDRWKLSARDLKIDDVKVDNADNAGTGIKKFKAALEAVSEIRSYYGAVQNRLEHTINNLDNVVENVTASESRIRDTDMAKVMTEYTTERILLQAGHAMLAQGNSSSQGVLSLLS